MEVLHPAKEVHIHLDAPNLAPSGYENIKLNARGPTFSSDAKWLTTVSPKVMENKEIITDDWNQGSQDARIGTAFGPFIEGLFE